MGNGMPISTYPTESIDPQVIYTPWRCAMPGASFLSAHKMIYSGSRYVILGAAPGRPMPMTSYATGTPLTYSKLDCSQGKWFAPGEAPGYIITAHPEGHTAQQEGHEMTNKAEQQVKLAELRETKAFEDLLREVAQRCLEAEERMEKAVATHDAMSAAWDNLDQEHQQTMTRDEAQKALDETEEAAKLAEKTMGEGIWGITG